MQRPVTASSTKPDRRRLSGLPLQPSVLRLCLVYESWPPPSVLRYDPTATTLPLPSPWLERGRRVRLCLPLVPTLRPRQAVSSLGRRPALVDASSWISRGTQHLWRSPRPSTHSQRSTRSYKPAAHQCQATDVVFLALPSVSTTLDLGAIFIVVTY